MGVSPLWRERKPSTLPSAGTTRYTDLLPASAATSTLPLWTRRPSDALQPASSRKAAADSAVCSFWKATA